MAGAHRPQASVPVRDIDAEFQASGPILERFLHTKTHRAFIMGALGSGKTFTAGMRALKISQEQAPDADGKRRTIGLVTRTNMTDLEASALKDWLELLDGQFKGALGRMHWASPAYYELRYKLPDGTRVEADVYFIGLDDPDGMTKIRGMPLTWAWLNECKDIPFGLVTMIYGRCGRFPRMEDGGPSWYGMFGDTNMPHAGHWLYEFAENEHPRGWEFFKQPGGVIKRQGQWILNPGAENLKFLPPNYYEDQLAGAAESWISVYLGANYGFALEGKPVYPDYVDTTHCHEFEIMSGVPLRIGMDFGGTPAAGVGQRMPNGQWRVHSEVVTQDFGIIRFAEAVQRHLHEHYPGFEIASVTGDPSGNAMQGGDAKERNVFQILKAHGIEAKPAHTNDPTLRREAVASYMRKMIDGEPGFILHPQCRIARIGFAGGFKYKTIRGMDGLVQVKPEKSMSSHICEGVEYMFMGAGENKTIVGKNNVVPIRKKEPRPRSYGTLGWMA